MDEMQKYIIFNGLKINNIPPYTHEKRMVGRPKVKVGLLSTVIEDVKKMERAFGITLKKKGQWGATFVGADKTKIK